MSEDMRCMQAMIHMDIQRYLSILMRKQRLNVLSLNKLLSPIRMSRNVDCGFLSALREHPVIGAQCEHSSATPLFGFRDIGVPGQIFRNLPIGHALYFWVDGE